MNGPGWYPENGAGRRALALGLFGLETWALVVLVPRLRHDFLGAPALAELAVLGLPLGLIALGLLVPLPLADRRTALVLGYPVALAASVAIRPDLTERDAFGPLSVGVIVVSLAIYLVLALTHSGGPQVLRATAAQPLPPEIHQAPSAASRAGRIVLAVASAGAASAVVLAFWGGRADALARFGEAADDASALAVVIGALLFAVAIGAVVGPGLRARKRTDARREAVLPRLAPFLALALVAALLRGALYVLDAR